MIVKPAHPGLVVRDPITGAILPDTGKEVEVNSYWNRRLKYGDVVLVTTKKTAKTKEE